MTPPKNMTTAELREADELVGRLQQHWLSKDHVPPSVIVGGDWPVQVPGSVRTACRDCGKYVGLSPGSGMQYVAKYPATPVVCLACATKRGGLVSDLRVGGRRAATLNDAVEMLLSETEGDD